MSQTSRKPGPLDQFSEEYAWVLWRYGPDGKKPPVPLDGSPLKKGDGPKALATTRDDLDTRRQQLKHDGIGFVAGQYGSRAVIAIDLDACFTPEGELQPWAAKVLEIIPSYTEFSPGGREPGLHVVAYVEGSAMFEAVKNASGAKPDGSGCARHWGRKVDGGSAPLNKNPEISIIVEGGYFTFTEDHYPDTPSTLAKVGAADITKLVRHAEQWLRGDPEDANDGSGLTDEEANLTLRELAAKRAQEPWVWPKTRAKVLATLDGSQDWGTDRSRALPAFGALLAALAFDKDQIEQACSEDWAPDVVRELVEEDRKKSDRQFDRLWNGREGKLKGWAPVYEEACSRRARGKTSRARHMDEVLAAHQISEDGVAKQLEERHGLTHLFDEEAGKWFVLEPEVGWKQVPGDPMFQAARLLAREIAEEASKDSTVVMLGKAAFAGGVDRLARTSRTFAVRGSETWDRDPWLLGTPGGTVDLRTGKLHAARRDEFITKRTSIIPASPGTSEAECPTFMRFLDEIACGDAELVGYLRRFAGYCLTGETREHAMIFAHGEGANGKSTLVELLAEIMGDYASTAAMSVFTAQKHEQHPTDIAMLRGARLVIASETNSGSVWNEARIKRMTGGDSITAHFMHKNNFTFKPEFKLWILGNHKPRLSDVDGAIRRRLNMVPFDLRLEPNQRDNLLPTKLRSEARAILRWMIDGCLEWQQEKLRVPEVVERSSDEYFSSMDTLQHFLDECCEVGSDVGCPTQVLWDSWAAWAEDNGHLAYDVKRLTEGLIRAKFVVTKARRETDMRRGFLGLRLKPSAPSQGSDRGAW